MGGQEDIDALLAANAPAKEEEPSGEVGGQEDIDALLAANAPAKEEKPSGEVGGQEDIDALLAASSPDEEEPAEIEDDEQDQPAEPTDSQGDIDALLSSLKEDEQQEQETAKAGGQEDIDALLESVGSQGDIATREDLEQMAERGEDRQDEIDALLSAHESGEDGGESGEIEKTQDEISEILSDTTSSFDAEEAGDTERADAPAGAGDDVDEDEDEEEAQDEAEIISQDDIDTLLADSDMEEAGEAEEPGEAEVAAVAGDEAEDELDKLLSSEEDSLGENLFSEEAETEEAEEEEPTLDDLLSQESGTEEESEQPVFAEEEEEESVLGIPSAPAAPEDEGQESEEPFFLEEQTEKEGGPSFVAALTEKLRAALGPLGSMAAKIPWPAKAPRAGAAIIALGAVLALGAGGGAYWFFYGGAVPEDMAGMVSGDSAPEPAQAPEQPAQKAKQPAAPVEESLVAGAVDEAAAGNEVTIGVYIPVEFDAEITKVMSVNVGLVFETQEQRDAARSRMFFSTVTVENAIDSFFSDKFYEETVFAQEKLERFLGQKLKTIEQMAGLKQVRLENLTFE